MNVLLTGATGFLGSHLAEQLAAAGDTVRALVRPTSDTSLLTRLGARLETGSLEDGDSLRRACAGCDVVYHCAARVDLVGDESQFHRTIVDGTRAILHAAAGAGVRRFVHVSSCGIYHPDLLTSGQPICESTPTPTPPSWFTYGMAKYLAEQEVMRLAPGCMEWVIVRVGYLYGPRNRVMQTYLRPIMADSVMMIIGDGSNELALIYVEDAARAVLLAGRTPAAAGQVLIAGPNERVTQRQYFDAMADGFGLPRPTKHVPYGVAFFFARLGESLMKRGPKAAVMRRSAIALTGLPQRIDCRYTQTLLGWTPSTPFAEGVRRAFAWYREEYREGENSE
jgi:nucleoside-diphosphate-sugar epimerase